MSELIKSIAWQALLAHQRKISGLRLRDLFRDDLKRFEKFSLQLPGLLFDYSKNLLTDETLQLLLTLARARNLEKARDALFSGAKINTTENRAALHTALRADKVQTVLVDNRDVMPEIQDVLFRLQIFTEAVRSGKWRGYTGKEITDIVNIGIGGSSLGPQLTTEALSADHHPRLRAHFVANVEASDLDKTLKRLSPETTLFIIASKTFTTAETMQNAHIARAWLLQGAAEDKNTAVEKHFVAVSTNLAAVKEFGIDTDNMFPFWDWVGGRYSIWSAIGLSVALMVGVEKFEEFLAGARTMDEHFKSAPLEKNAPVLMGLLGVWYRNFCSYPAYACIPYHSNLRRLAAWLQQLDMESNGKSVDKNGIPVNYATGPIIFGEPGTDAQHSFFQWLHQSPTPVPVDFIAAVNSFYGTVAQQKMLLANFLAQTEALMTGQKADEPHRNFSGSRPTNTILLDALTPHTLGMLLALYEHKIFVQGVLWNINSFDQWGVELGKTLAKKLQGEMESDQTGEHDSSTEGLLKYMRERF